MNIICTCKLFILRFMHSLCVDLHAIQYCFGFSEKKILRFIIKNLFDPNGVSKFKASKLLNILNC